MDTKKKNKNYIYLDLPRKEFAKTKKKRNISNKCLIYTIIIVCFCVSFIIYELLIKKVPSTSTTISNPSTTFINSKEKFYFDKYEPEKFHEIQSQLKQECIDMWGNQREFLNGESEN